METLSRSIIMRKRTTAMSAKLKSSKSDRKCLPQSEGSEASKSSGASTRTGTEEPIRKEAIIRSAERAGAGSSSGHLPATPSREQSPASSYKSRSSTGESGTPCLPVLSTLPTAANKLYQSAKEQIEQSINLDTGAKENVLADLSGLYEIVLRLSESRQTLQLQLERARSQTKEELYIREKDHARKLGQLAESVKEADVRSPLGEILAEVKSLRQIVVFELVEGQNNPTVRDHATKPDITQLGNELAQLKEATESSMVEIKEIKNLIKNAEPRKTYAEMTAMPNKPSHSIIVSSSLDKDTSEDVLSEVRRAVEAKQSGAQIDRIRKTKNQKVVISCSTQEEIIKVREKLTRIEKLSVETAKNKDPMVIIKDVLAFNTDEDIITSLKTQNNRMLGDIPKEEFRAIVKYRKRARNPHENHVVLQVSPKIWQKMTACGQVHIDLQKRYVYDQSPLIQCTKCLGYGHGRKLCKEALDLCSHCSGPHLRKDCPVWTVGDIPSCRNCCLARLDRQDHSAFDLKCPVRKRWDALARSSVAYC